MSWLTLEDVISVLEQLPSSSPGPYAIPFAAYKTMRHDVAPIFLEITQRMLDPNCPAPPPEDFNWAFLVCLPKKATRTNPDGTEVYDAGGTCPLSVVDASNRILTNVFRAVLEKRAAAWVSESQRGFLPGRSMIRNVVDIDFAAQNISLKSRARAILLYDFRAASPSISHEFMWDVLDAIGIHHQFIRAIKMFYTDNWNQIRVQGELFDSVNVRSGIR